MATEAIPVMEHMTRATGRRLWQETSPTLIFRRVPPAAALMLLPIIPLIGYLANTESGTGEAQVATQGQVVEVDGSFPPEPTQLRWAQDTAYIVEQAQSESLNSEIAAVFDRSDGGDPPVPEPIIRDLTDNPAVYYFSLGAWPEDKLPPIAMYASTSPPNPDEYIANLVSEATASGD